MCKLNVLDVEKWLRPGLGIETQSVSKHNVRFVPEHFWKRERFLKTRFETQKSFLFLSLNMPLLI